MKENYEQMEQVRERLLELLHYQKNRLAYRQRTEIAVEIVRQIETEEKFPHLFKSSSKQSGQKRKYWGLVIALAIIPVLV